MVFRIQSGGKTLGRKKSNSRHAQLVPYPTIHHTPYQPIPRRPSRFGSSDIPKHTSFSVQSRAEKPNPIRIFRYSETLLFPFRPAGMSYVVW
eukprot:scaffold575_cov186-Amphora_coffeaeformis.AAC.11